MSQIPPDESGVAAKLTELITRSHKEANDNALQQEAIQAAVDFIHSHGDEKHLFCNRDMYAVSVHALILFSFGEADNEALDWYKKRIAQSLDSCTKCMSMFQRGRVKLKETFITDRGVDAENVESFSQSILAWEAKRLLPKFINSLKLYKTEKDNTEKASVPRELLMCFAECLCGPGMLRMNQELRGLFDRLLFLLLSQDHHLVKKAIAITPGMIFLVMEGDEIQKRWSFKMFKELSKHDNPLKASQIQLDVLEEFEHYLKFIQVPENNTEANKENFYRGLYALFEVMDESAIIDKVLTFAKLRPISVDTDDPIQLTIFQCLRDHIMSYPDSSLPYILRFFKLVLLKVNDRFWSHIGEYTFQNIMGTIINNPNLIKGFALLKDTARFSGELNPASRISDLLDWIDPFLESLGFSQRLKSTETLTMFLITQLENQQSISLEVKAKLFIKACQLLSSALALPSQLYSSSLTTDLLARSDTRVVVNSKLVRFFDYGTSAAIFFPEFEREKNGDVVRSAISVICKALRFDILTFAQNSYEIQKGKKPSTLRFSAQLFQAILKQSFPRQLELAYQLLCSMENVSTILPVGAQTAEVKEFLRYLSQFFVKFTDVDPKNTKMILSNHKSLKGYWACVFSPDESVYQSAVDVLYETFDAAGRLEGVHALLENSIDFCIQAINDNLTNLIFIEFFEPCPRAVKVLTDVLQSLNSPRDGLLTDHENFNHSTRKSLVLFWNRCWKFLDLIYVQTIKWAEKYSDLVEFTRDTLDLSHSLLNCFKTIKMISDDGDSLKVFNEITSTFPHMLVWLRLSDPGLLSSCVKLISSTVDLATDLDYKLDTNVIELLARYGSRAKKFNNRLTATQSEEILDRARVFDAKLVDAVVHESEEYRKSKNGTPPSTTSTAGSTREATPSSYSLSSSTAPPRMKGQMKVDNFGSLSKTAPVAPGKPKLPKSQLELARERLNAKKAALGQSGTHRRREQQDSDDSDVEGDDAYALFNIKKPPKKAGITLLEDKWTQQRKFMQEKKKEEEYSRLRLNVDMKPLYKRVLQWSFLRSDDFPDSELNSLTPVADTFKNADDYIKTYEPLLLVECWSAICAAKNREDFKPMMITIGSKSSVNDFFEVFCSISKSMLSEKNITDSDLVVLAFSDKSMDFIPRVADVKKSTVSCFGKIHEIKHVKGDRADLTIRVSRSGSMNNWLNPHSTVMMMRVMQMTTIEREFSSLHGLRYYNLANQILEAKPYLPIDVSQSDMEKIRETYKVNDSQAKAIGSSVNTDGFSLIQGPPGTGKTKTILGVIGYMLSSFQTSNVIAVPQGQKASFSPSQLQDFKGRKVLVCAPSNAAVDELVLRMKDGIMNSKGEKYVPKLVRLGRSDAINSSVKDMTLEELVDAQLGKSSTIANNMDGLFKQLNEIKKKMEVCKIKIADEKNPAGDEVYQEKRELTKKANAIKQNLDEEREKQNSHYRNREITRRNLQAKILSEAEIICSTLSGSAHDMVANLGIKFDSVIIDEACQCTELSAVIPLRYGCKRCIMVGDPNQLPPTVLSSAAADALYDQSLFVRMAKNTKPLLLNVQYRMNSAISRFPSKMFYDSQLLDGPQNNALTTRVWHQNELFPPYKFYDIVDGQQLQNKKTFSFTNEIEVRIAIELVNKLFSTFNHLDFKNKIGIVTPYKEQNRLLQKSFVREFGSNIKSEISFNTIDGFQGQEKDIIIMSCVRADAAAKGVGFLRDFRRMNVALTRPKCSMWILGHHDSLIKNNLWKSLIEDAKERNCLTEAREGFTSGVIKPSKLDTTKAHIQQKEFIKKAKQNKLNGSRASDPSHDTKPHEKMSNIPADRADSRSWELRPSEPLKPMNNGVLPPRENTVPTPVSDKLPEPAPVRSSTVPSRPLPTAPTPKGPLAHPIPTGPSSSSQYPPVSRSGSLPPMPSNSGSLPPHRPHQRKRPPQSSIFIQKRRRR